MILSGRWSQRYWWRLAGFLSVGLGEIACGQDDLTNRVPLGSGVVLELVTIAPGSFQQGSPTSEAGRGADET